MVTLLKDCVVYHRRRRSAVGSLRLVPISRAGLASTGVVMSLVFDVLVCLLLFIVAFSIRTVLRFRSLSVKLILDFLGACLLSKLKVFFTVSPVVTLMTGVGGKC